MINKDDGLSILNGIIQCSENKFDLSNNENLEYFMKSYPPIDIYKKYHSNLSEKNNDDANINSLLFLNLLTNSFIKFKSLLQIAVKINSVCSLFIFYPLVQETSISNFLPQHSTSSLKNELFIKKRLFYLLLFIIYTCNATIM